MLHILKPEDYIMLFSKLLTRKLLHTRSKNPSLRKASPYNQLDTFIMSPRTLCYHLSLDSHEARCSQILLCNFKLASNCSPFSPRCLQSVNLLINKFFSDTNILETSFNTGKNSPAAPPNTEKC